MSSCCPNGPVHQAQAPWYWKPVVPPAEICVLQQHTNYTQCGISSDKELQIAKIQIRSGMLEQVQSMKSPTTLRHLGLRRQHLDTAVTLSRGDVPPPQQVRPQEILIHYGVLMDCNFSDMFCGCSVRFRSRDF